MKWDYICTNRNLQKVFVKMTSLVKYMDYRFCNFVKEIFYVTGCQKLSIKIQNTATVFIDSSAAVICAAKNDPIKVFCCFLSSNVRPWPCA